MAGLISRETIDAVQNRTDIAAVVGEYTKLEKRGSDWWGCCPFHNEKTPSFHIDTDKRLYYCFGCHAGGDVIKFVMEMEKVSYTEAIRILAKRDGIEVVYADGRGPLPEQEKKDNTRELYIELYNRVSVTFHYLLTQNEWGKDALAYITGRGLTMETLEKFKLGYTPRERKWLRSFLQKKNYSDEFLDNSGLFSKKYPDFAFFSDRLMFPIFDRKGQVVAFGGRLLQGDGPKYLNSGDLIQYKKGETLYAFNFAKETIREKKRVIFCEGYMDVIAYHQCGITYAVAPLGTALTVDQIHIIKSFVDTVLLSFDSDGAGQAATLRGILMCRQEGLTVKVICLTGGKDPAEIMVAFGAETLTNEVENAILDSDFLLSKLEREYPVDTPEGKTRAALAFFPYIDSLQSDMQKVSCLEQLCQKFNLDPEAVKRDFSNRDQARERVRIKPLDEKEPVKEVKLTSELRAVLAMVANLDFYSTVHTELTTDDFEDPLAKKLYIALEECFREDTLTLTSVINHCDDELQMVIQKVIAYKEFSDDEKKEDKEHRRKIVQDCIVLIKQNTLRRKRTDIMNRIRLMKPVTAADEETLQNLISEKMEIDKELQR